MTDARFGTKRGAAKSKVQSNPLSPLGVVAGALATIAVIYLGYDLVKGRVSPCDAIFRQSSVGLTTSFRFLKSEGALQIGRDQLVDLDQRGQMAALNLKTCCTVLDAGRLDPEQFLQCKANARNYESRVKEIVALVRAAAPAVKTGEVSPGDAAAATGNAPAAPAPNPEIAKKIEAARSVSKQFNLQVVGVQTQQTLRTLAAVPSSNVKITAKEREPNNDVLNTNIVTLGEWVSASIGEPKDNDYFSFTTPKTHRDWIRVEITNRSTTLEPNFQYYSSTKTHIGGTQNTTPGGDLTFSFVGAPDTTYMARISNYYGASVGVYNMRVIATKSYDEYEPNDGIFGAHEITSGSAITADIMDKHDVDFFKFTTGNEPVAWIAQIENGTPKLHPRVQIFDSAKTLIGGTQNTTGGGDVSFAFKGKANATYYVLVNDYYTDGSGAYTLTVKQQ